MRGPGGAAIALVAALLLSGCRATPRVPQHSGPLEIRFLQAGARGGAYTAPPAGFDWFACEIEVINRSKSTVTVHFKDGELFLYQGSTAIGGQGEGTSSTAAEASGRGFDETSWLPPGGTVYVGRNFLVKPDQRNLVLVYRLPSYGEFKWQVR